MSSAPTYKMGNHVVDGLKVWERTEDIAEKPFLSPHAPNCRSWDHFKCFLPLLISYWRYLRTWKISPMLDVELWSVERLQIKKFWNYIFHCSWFERQVL